MCCGTLPHNNPIQKHDPTQEFPISCLIPLATTELRAAINSFCILGLVYVAFRGIVLMTARKRWFSFVFAFKYVNFSSEAISFNCFCVEL